MVLRLWGAYSLLAALAAAGCESRAEKEEAAFSSLIASVSSEEDTFDWRRWREALAVLERSQQFNCDKTAAAFERELFDASTPGARVRCVKVGEASARFVSATVLGCPYLSLADRGWAHGGSVHHVNVDFFGLPHEMKPKPDCVGRRHYQRPAPLPPPPPP